MCQQGNSFITIEPTNERISHKFTFNWLGNKKDTLNNLIQDTSENVGKFGVALKLNNKKYAVQHQVGSILN